MKTGNSYEILIVSAVILGLMARYFLARLWNETRLSARLGMIAGLFLVYTAGLMLMLWQVYHYIADKEGSIGSYYHMVMLTVPAVNTIVLFAGVLYYFVRGKRKLSGTDKMKLMDL